MKKFVVLLGFMVMALVTVPQSANAGACRPGEDGCITAKDIAFDAISSNRIVSVSGTKVTGTVANATNATNASNSDTLDGLNSTDFAPAVIGTDNIADGAVTSAKIEDIENVIIVAKAGGDYSTIQAAINAASGTAAAPVVIDVMPGEYTEGTLTMKSYVSLRGAGREVTMIDTESSSTEINLTGTVNNSISGFELWTKILCSACENLTVSDNFIWGYGGTGVEINSGSSDYYIHDNIIRDMSAGIVVKTGTGNYYIRDNITIGGNPGIAIDNNDNGNGYISGNHIMEAMNYGLGLWYSTGNYNVSNNTIEDCQSPLTTYLMPGATANIANNIIKNSSYGIGIYDYGTLKVSGNIFSGGTQSGIYISRGETSESLFVEVNDVDGFTKGIQFSGSFNSGTIVKGNTITGSSIADIYNPPASGVIHSYNIYDTVSGGTVIGAYNSKSDGTPW